MGSLSKLDPSKLWNEVKELVKPHTPQFCYQCAKCTSTCTASKVIPEYRPHVIVAFARMGLIEELLGSGIIWACTECWKCSEYCPQNVAPVEVVIALKNLAIALGYKPPDDIKAMARNVLEFGYISQPVSIMSKEFELYNREHLGLPKLSKPYLHEVLSNKLKNMFNGAIQ